jgi:hypothetical protein
MTQDRQPFLTKKTFAFTVHIRNEAWDCYHFEDSDGQRGTLGFTKRGAKFVIGLMCKGHLTEREAKRRIETNEKAN